jgi:hypothetical protein
MVTEVPTVNIYAGDTTVWPTYTFTDEAQQPRDLVNEGWSFWTAQWRPKADAATFIDLVVDASQASTGVVKISASSIDTALMGGNGVWDLQAISNGAVKTWVRGKTKWTEDVTRD